MTNKRDKASVVGDIAKTICEYVDAKGGAVRIVGTCAPEMLYFSHNAGIGEALYEKGYMQPPKDAVIFIGTETEERLEDLLIDFDEMSFFPGTLTPDPDAYAREWKEKLIYTIGKLQEETAEKFAKKLKAEYAILDGEQRVRVRVFRKDIDKICKEIARPAGVIAELECVAQKVAGTTHEVKSVEEDAPRRVRVFDVLQYIDPEIFVEVRPADDRAIVCDSGTPDELMEANRECLYTNVATIEPRSAAYMIIFCAEEVDEE